ncbi:MAG: pyrroline-5-carboxylate reductase [Lachnospiraceae bacterium]|nr:pyrroline-5-carboxylate reductase [Lachnospiraceae bacterium]
MSILAIEWRVNMQIGFIGAGNMAQAIIKGLINKKVVESDDIIVNDTQIDILSDVKTTYEVNVTIQKKEVLRFSDVIILAVKPNNIEEVIEDIKQDMKLFNSSTIFISIAAGVSLETLEKYFSNDNNSNGFGYVESLEDDFQLKIVRAMPNMPAAVGEGMTGITSNKNVKFSDIDQILKIFGAIGKVELVEEKMMDAVVALSGSSPAYMYLILDAMATAAEKAGMKKSMALKFAAQAMIGSGKVILDKKEDPQELIKKVCSPGGTTIEAMDVLEKNNVKDIFIDAMDACMEKSKSLMR